MRYIGFVRDLTNGGRINEKNVLEVYLFDNPILRRYTTGYVGVEAVGNKYRIFRSTNNGFLSEAERDEGFSIGIRKENLFRLNRNADLDEISKRIGLSRKELTYLLKRE